MKCVRFPLFTVLLFAGGAPVGAVSPTVSRVRGAQQLPGQGVDIYYDLADADSAAVRVALEVSSDGGATWTVPATSLSGAGFGGAVVPGPDRHIRWEAGADWPGQKSNTMRFRVTANDDVPPPATMAWIPAGSFQMGNSTNAAEGEASELPVHSVYVSAFYMDRYEVTKQLWDEVRTWGATHGYSGLGIGGGNGATHPVQAVGWYDVVKWCNARSEKEGLTPVYYTNDAQTTVYKTGDVSVTNAQVKWGANGYRLPTEAEWEKAARGGLNGKRFSWGDTITHSAANYVSSSSYSYDVSLTRGYHPAYSSGSFPYTSPVGSFPTNGHGLFDMTGNVWELCWDWYSATWYSQSGATVNDPKGPPSGSYRTLRSGSWGHTPEYLRTSWRGINTPGGTNFNIGFRSVRS